MATIGDIAHPVGWSAEGHARRQLRPAMALVLLAASAFVVELQLAGYEHGTHLLILLVAAIIAGRVFGPTSGGLGLALAGGVATVVSIDGVDHVVGFHDALVQLTAYLLIGAAFIVLTVRSGARRLERAAGPARARDRVASIASPTRGVPDVRETLTPREHEVLRLAATGMSVDEIAHGLGVSQNTVKTHLTRVYGKLAARGRSDAIRIALHSGWLAPTDICPHLDDGAPSPANHRFG